MDTAITDSINPNAKHLLSNESVDLFDNGPDFRDRRFVIVNAEGMRFTGSAKEAAYLFWINGGRTK